jgi:hypothetical protein
MSAEDLNTTEDLIPIRIGSKEVQMPKTFTVKDLKNVASIEKDRSVILHRGGKAINLADNDKVDVQDGDYFKDVPPLEQGK